MVKPHMLVEALLPLLLFVVTFPSVVSGAGGDSGSDEGSGSSAPGTSTPAQGEPQSASKAGFFIGPTLGIFFVGLIAVLLLYFIYGEGPTNKEHKKIKKKKPSKKNKVKKRELVADSEQTPFLNPGAGVDVESQKMSSMVQTPFFVTPEKTVVMQMPPPQVNIFVAPPPPMGSMMAQPPPMGSMMAQQLPQWQAPPSSQGSRVSSFDAAWGIVPGVAPGPGGVPAVVPNMVPGAVPFVVHGAPWNVVPSGMYQRPPSNVGSMAQQTATGAGIAANRGEHASTADVTGAGTAANLGEHAAANLGEHASPAAAAQAAGDLSGSVQ